MKKTLTSILLFASATIAFGQSIHILHDNVDVTAKEITVPVYKNNEFVTELALKNTTGGDVDYKVSRTILNPPFDPCSYILYCTGIICYGPNNDITFSPPDISTIKANETLPNGPNTYGIAAHYSVCETACADLNVLYRVYNTAAGSKDTATVKIKYTCTNGITEENPALGSLSNAYPNPTNNGFTVKYAMKTFSQSEIAVYDLFGKKVIETKLPKAEGTITINTSSLAPGVYYYSLVVNNQRATTKRLVISE